MEPGAAGVLTTATVSHTEKLVYLAFELGRRPQRDCDGADD
jgi:hypothetical protein